MSETATTKASCELTEAASRHEEAAKETAATGASCELAPTAGKREAANEAKPSIAEFADTLRRIRDSLDGLSDAQLSWKPAPDKWSVKEVVAHLVDSSIVHSVRARKIVAEPLPALPVYDQDAWVAGARSNEAALADILRAYEAILHYNALFYGRLADADWEKEGDTNGKRVTVAELFRGFIRHVGIHLAQIERTKAALPAGAV